MFHLSGMFPVMIAGIAATAFPVSGAAPPFRIDCGAGISLGFEADSGRWCSLRYRGRELLTGEAGPDFEVFLDRDRRLGAAKWHASPPVLFRYGDRNVARVRRTCRGWDCLSEFTILPGRRTIIRRVTLEYTGTAPAAISRTELRVPGVTLGDAADALWTLPGNYPAGTHRVRDALPGRREREQGWTWAETGVAWVFAPKARIGLAADFALREDHAFAAVEEGRRCVTVLHEFRTLARLKPGDTLTIGDQWLRIAAGDRAALKRACRDLAAETAAGPPPDRPAWLDGAVLAELHPWGRLEDWRRGDRGNRFADLVKELPALHELGVNSIWLLPVSQKPPWVYQLPEFGRIAPQLGDAAQLRNFITRAHALGFHVLMDLVTYGVSPESPEVAKLPDTVWCRDAQGRRVKVWGGSVLAADCTVPAWREKTVERALDWVRHFGCDGFRLDCGGAGQAPNWRPPHGVRANAAMLAGGIGQNAWIRKAIRSINPDAVLLPEAGASPYFRAADGLFDYPLYRACREIVRTGETGAWVSRLRHWLASRQYSLSREQEAAQVRFLENHDCVAAQDYFGVGPSQALAALAVFLPGIFLLHQDQEIGFAPALRRWLHLRSRLPEFRSGTADYETVRANPAGVLAFLRKAGPEHVSVIAVNFSSVPVTAALHLPPELTHRLPVCRDAFSGEILDSASPLRILPWRPRVMVLRRNADSALPRPLGASVFPTAGPASLLLEQTAETEKNGLRRWILRFKPVKEWALHTTEGLLRGAFRDHHRRFRETETQADAITPLRRCFHPTEFGLFAGPGAGAAAVIGAGGHVTEIRMSAPGAWRDFRIEDSSKVGAAVRFIIEPTHGDRPPPFSVIEHAAAEKWWEQWCALPTRAVKGPLAVDPLRAVLRSSSLRAEFARRCGGALLDLRASPGAPSWTAGLAELYTDWGLYAKGLHVSTQPETNPRLTFRGDGRAVAFTGRLRRPPWNGVQTGPPVSPGIAYRLEYELLADSALRITVGFTPKTSRPDTRAFLAFRVPFAGIERWEVRKDGNIRAEGRAGEHKGKRVFQTGDHAWARTGVSLRLERAEGALVIRAPEVRNGLPQNVFLLEDGNGRFSLFFALLEGDAVSLTAGTQYRASFDIRLAPRPTAR